MLGIPLTVPNFVSVCFPLQCDCGVTLRLDPHNRGVGESIDASGNTVIVAGSSGSFEHDAQVFRFDGVSWSKESLFEPGYQQSLVARIDRNLAAVGYQGSAVIVPFEYIPGSGWRAYTNNIPGVRGNLTAMSMSGTWVAAGSQNGWVSVWEVGSDATEEDIWEIQLDVARDVPVRGVKLEGTRLVFSFMHQSLFPIARVMRWNGTTFVQEGNDISLEGDSGYSIGLQNGDILMNETPIDEPGGVVSVFRQSGDNWERIQRIANPEGNTQDEFGRQGKFGSSIACDGNWLFVGAPQDSLLRTESSGVVYSFVKEDGAWILRDRFFPDGRKPCGVYGTSISTANGKLFVSEPGITGCGNKGGHDSRLFVYDSFDRGPLCNSDSSLHLRCFERADCNLMVTLKASNFRPCSLIETVLNGEDGNPCFRDRAITDGTGGARFRYRARAGVYDFAVRTVAIDSCDIIASCD